MILVIMILTISLIILLLINVILCLYINLLLSLIILYNTVYHYVYDSNKINNTSLINYDIFNTFKLSIIYFRDLHFPCHEVNHYTYFVFEISLIITCYTAYSYISLIYFIKQRYHLLLIRSVHHTCYTYINTMFMLYRKVILFIIHCLVKQFAWSSLPLSLFSPNMTVKQFAWSSLPLSLFSPNMTPEDILYFFSTH